ncbi:MAG: hypothetical protein HOI29_01325 [Planctomycetes bacterium]|nr:hypothetical protein [Planctomycetota bacterium]MBT6451991.1 hypothetical protein [Planctomycetota bacterium]MBT6541687.1 hypothetical protein [Planctomycetota bacterium]MBT6783933.1 hypothetical protein [Planctomycetota bacterium]MBT6967215.1 hypothetical protein [Planctomycetota bacterium]
MVPPLLGSALALPGSAFALYGCTHVPGSARGGADAGWLRFVRRKTCP